MRIENLPFAELFETVLREIYADETITGISVVVNRNRQASVYHTGDMDNLSLIAAGYRADINDTCARLEEQLEELRHEIGEDEHDTD